MIIIRLFSNENKGKQEYLSDKSFTFSEGSYSANEIEPNKNYPKPPWKQQVLQNNSEPDLQQIFGGQQQDESESRSQQTPDKQQSGSKSGSFSESESQLQNNSEPDLQQIFGGQQQDESESRSQQVLDKQQGGSKSGSFSESESQLQNNSEPDLQQIFGEQQQDESESRSPQVLDKQQSGSESGSQQVLDKQQDGSESKYPASPGQESMTNIKTEINSPQHSQLLPMPLGVNFLNPSTDQEGQQQLAGVNFLNQSTDQEGQQQLAGVNFLNQSTDRENQQQKLTIAGLKNPLNPQSCIPVCVPQKKQNQQEIFQQFYHIGQKPQQEIDSPELIRLLLKKHIQQTQDSRNKQVNRAQNNNQPLSNQYFPQQTLQTQNDQQQSFQPGPQPKIQPQGFQTQKQQGFVPFKRSHGEQPKQDKEQEGFQFRPHQYFGLYQYLELKTLSKEHPQQDLFQTNNQKKDQQQTQTPEIVTPQENSQLMKSDEKQTNETLKKNHRKEVDVFEMLDRRAKKEKPNKTIKDHTQLNLKQPLSKELLAAFEELEKLTNHEKTNEKINNQKLLNLKKPPGQELQTAFEELERLINPIKKNKINNQTKKQQKIEQKNNEKLQQIKNTAVEQKSVLKNRQQQEQKRLQREQQQNKKEPQQNKKEPQPIKKAIIKKRFILKNPAKNKKQQKIEQKNNEKLQQIQNTIIEKKKIQ